MQIVRGHRNAPAWGGAAVAIGNFDGVHLGHRALIVRARVLASANSALAVALTFDPHPSCVVGRGCPPMLSSLERRLEALEAAGLDAVVVEPFTMSLANLAPHAFVDDVLMFGLRARISQLLLRQPQLFSYSLKIHRLHDVTNGYISTNPLSSLNSGLLIMEQKALSGVESVHNQVRDTASE